MVCLSSFSTVASIGKFLVQSGYDAAHLGNDLALSDGLHANHGNLDVLLTKTEGDSILAVLARLFFVGWPVSESRCRAALPDTFLAAALDCGLLTEEATGFTSSACLIPFRSLLIACDSFRARNSLPDMVTGPSASTHFPARLAVGGQDETTLDLGTGTGVLALEAARYSNKVVGTDINPRTLKFAEFNAALNGIADIQWRCGDAFEPVHGERFTRIIANPPFFLSPAKTFTYCDSPLDLDGFAERLARECSSYLEEGGFYQMICEWVEIEGQSWEERLRNWTSQSECDVLVLIAPRLTPIAYAEKRTAEALLMQAQAGHSFSDRLQYLTDRHVKSIIGGVITMRKRTAVTNWFTVFGTEPVGNQLGPDVRARFDALTFLSTATDAEFFQSRFRLSEDVVLDKRSAASANGWQTTTVDLIKVSGLIDRLRLDETVSMFLPLFNGDNTVQEIARTVAEQLQISSEEAQQRCLQLARRLSQSNFLQPIDLNLQK